METNDNTAYAELMPTAGEYELPDIDMDSYEWVPIPRIGRTVPFGYMLCEDDNDILVPIPDELDLLEQAKKHLRLYSYREVAAWLTTQSGRSISHMGLKKRQDSDRKNKTKARSANYWAERYAKAKAIAEKYEAHRKGARNFADRRFT